MAQLMALAETTPPQISSLRALHAERLHAYLLELPEGAVLPKMRQIAHILKLPQMGGGAYSVCEAFDRLSREGRLRQQHGTRHENRGARIVQLINGRILKTEHCRLVLE